MSNKTADQWFDEYAISHRNSANKLIHWICVPTIYAAVIGLLWDIPVPAAIQGIPLANWATAAAVVAMAFYFRLALSIGLGMLIFTGLIFALIGGYERLSSGGVWTPSLIIFVVAWIFQFIGHKIEGAKPSFLKDIQFLLVGPAWLLGYIYRRSGVPY
jgi:uncharacterized membrane protein YGL010W